jgi:hypothetical protein
MWKGNCPIWQGAVDIKTTGMTAGLGSLRWINESKFLSVPTVGNRSTEQQKCGLVSQVLMSW